MSKILAIIVGAIFAVISGFFVFVTLYITSLVTKIRVIAL